MSLGHIPMGGLLKMRVIFNYDGKHYEEDIYPSEMNHMGEDWDYNLGCGEDEYDFIIYHKEDTCDDNGYISLIVYKVQEDGNHHYVDEFIEEESDIFEDVQFFYDY